MLKWNFFEIEMFIFFKPLQNSVIAVLNNPLSSVGDYGHPNVVHYMFYNERVILIFDILV